jgi:uncharacterized membrane protein YqiK
MGDVPSQFIPSVTTVASVIVVVLLLIFLKKSLHRIGSDEFGLVIKNFGKKLSDGQLIALNGEAGYQPDLLMPGARYKQWPLYTVRRKQLVQIPPGGIGIVISQVGMPLDQGAKTAKYNDALGDFSDVRKFLSNSGQRGVQRPVLPPGTTTAMHPIAFVVATSGGVFGESLSEGTESLVGSLSPQDTMVTQIGTGPGNSASTALASMSKKAKRALQDQGIDMASLPSGFQPSGDSDMIGVVTVLDGPPLPSGDMAGRIGGFEDIKELEAAGTDPNQIIQTLLGSKNDQHNNYQNFQAFLDHGGCIGMQHDVLRSGAYLLNPFCVSVEQVEMLVVNQGEVSVIKSYVGLPTEDTSGEDYKFGSIVNPGHRGIWNQALGTGKYGLNPHIYDPVKVPTSILTLNWARATSEAHDLDKRLSAIDAKSKDAFDFSIDLQVLIHVPDTRAPKVIGMVGKMENLVNEVLQAAVGNYFRNRLQAIPATSFIETREEIQTQAEVYVKQTLSVYDVEVRGVYIQDVVLPDALVTVLNAREIANQEKTTYAAQQDAQQARIALEAQRGEADMQVELARARVSVAVNAATAEAAVKEAEGAASVTKLSGDAEATRIKAIGEANGAAARALGEGQAAAYEAQKRAIGPEQTAMVAILHEISEGGIKITPDTVVGDSAGGSGLFSLLLTNLATKGTPNGDSKVPVGAASPSEATSSQDGQTA